MLQNGSYVPSGVPFNEAYRYADWLITVPLLLITEVEANALLASVVFVGLSILTVPHMAVMALGRKYAAEPSGERLNS